jgi:glycosyltransferase involved in cell wall biosynthesis
MKSKTSVIITTYNDSKFLKRSIPSIINQSLEPFEIIIIDDGSNTNEAEEISRSYSKLTHIPIIFKKKKNGGPSSARNFGIQLAKGEYILFVDADDELLLDSIEWRQKKLEELGERYASIYCSSIHFFQKKSKLTKKVQEINGELNVCLVGRENGIPGQITSHFFQKKVLLEIKGYNEKLKFNEDFELILRIAKKWLFYGVNKVGFIQYFRNDSWSKSDPIAAFNGVENFLEIAQKNSLLPLVEVSKRKKENRLTLAKKLLIKEKKIYEAVPYIDEAFNIVKPENLKEHFINIFNKIAKKMNF